MSLRNCLVPLARPEELLDRISGCALAPRLTYGIARRARDSGLPRQLLVGKKKSVKCRQASNIHSKHLA